MVGNCHDLEQRSRRLSQESSSCESLTSNDFLTDSDDHFNDHLNQSVCRGRAIGTKPGMR